MTNTRRKFPRVAWPVEATYGTEDETHTTRTLDVSDGGALLSVDQNLSPGTRLMVKFHIDDFDLDPEPARVVRNGSAFEGTQLLMAVEFERPHPGLATATEFDREKSEWRNSRILRDR